MKLPVQALKASYLKVISSYLTGKVGTAKDHGKNFVKVRPLVSAIFRVIVYRNNKSVPDQVRAVPEINLWGDGRQKKFFWWVEVLFITDFRRLGGERNYVYKHIHCKYLGNGKTYEAEIWYSMVIYDADFCYDVDI